MKKLIMPFLFFLISGCAGMQLEDQASNNVLAYASGKTMAITIHKLVPAADPDLTQAWVDLMERTETMETIPSDEMLMFYNECAQIIASPIKDPYGLIGDLSVLLTIYAAEFDENSGKMTTIQPVPMEIMKFFEMGYDSGRKVARKE